MKMISPALTAILVLGLFTLTASAKVHSFLTAEELFICNAGIAHPSSNSPAGSDSVVVGFEDASMPEESEARYRTETLSVAPGSPSLKFAQSEMAAWDQNVLTTAFDLSTENYGTQYFVDICYRGPLAKKQGPQDLSHGLYNLAISAQISGSSNAESYQQKSRLSASVEVICDLRNKGASSAARTSEDLRPNGVEVDNLINSGDTSFQGQQLQMTFNLNDQKQAVPRFCRMRLKLKENATSTIRASNQSAKDIDLFINIEKF